METEVKLLIYMQAFKNVYNFQLHVQINQTDSVHVIKQSETRCLSTVYRKIKMSICNRKYEQIRTNKNAAIVCFLKGEIQSDMLCLPNVFGKLLCVMGAVHQ